MVLKLLKVALGAAHHQRTPKPLKRLKTPDPEDEMNPKRV